MAVAEARLSVGIRLSSVKRERVEWLWQHRIPLGKITLLDGDPGLGKSLATLDLAARITRGDRMPPDGSPGLDGGVVLLNAEDGLADTILPRLEAARANTDRVLSLATIKLPNGTERVTKIPGDLQHIVAGVREIGAKLVIIDPLMAFLAGEVNSYRDQDVRAALTPLGIVADRDKFSVLAVRHLTKGSMTGSPLYRGGGSIAFIGAARSAMVVGEDPNDRTRRVLAPTKSNLGPPPSSLAFHIEATDDIPHVVWDGKSEHAAEAILAQATSEEQSQRSSAKDFLIEVLAHGAVDSAKVITQGEALDLKQRTLWRAKKELKVIARKSGFAGGWTWELPNNATP